MFQESYMRKIVAALGIVATIALAAYAYSALKQTKYMYQGPTSISVSGEGEVFAKPDVASFSFTLEAKEADAVTAQNKVSEAMDAILAYLKEAGVEERDVKTEYYNLAPWYEYPAYQPCTYAYCPPQNGEPTLKGYEVSQSVTVKIRDIAKAGEIISEVGGKGAKNVSGIQMTVDDTDALKDEARALAIENAKEKAEALAKSLGVRLVRMNGFWEEEGYGYYDRGYGMGGEMMMEDSMMSAPKAATLPAGENRITARVNISYEIR
jgi:uncharacterized protein